MDASAGGEISTELVQACAEVCNASALQVKPRTKAFTDAAVQQSGSPESVKTCVHVSDDCTTERAAEEVERIQTGSIKPKMRGVIVHALIDRVSQAHVLVLPGAARYADAVHNTRTRIQVM